MNGWVLQSRVYLARFAQAIHSLVVGKTSETDAVHLQEPVTCRGKITRRSKQFLLFLHWWLCSPKLQSLSEKLWLNAKLFTNKYRMFYYPTVEKWQIFGHKWFDLHVSARPSQQHLLEWGFVCRFFQLKGYCPSKPECNTGIKCFKRRLRFNKTLNLLPSSLQFQH